MVPFSHKNGPLKVPLHIEMGPSRGLLTVTSSKVAYLAEIMKAMLTFKSTDETWHLDLREIID